MTCKKIFELVYFNVATIVDKSQKQFKKLTICRNFKNKDHKSRKITEIYLLLRFSELKQNPFFEMETVN